MPKKRFFARFSLCSAEHIMTHSAINSNTFLAYFNHIDTFFEVVLGLKTYMPFTEKVDRISEGRYPITAFTRKYQHKLKYFSDLRNQVVHGFRLEQHHYLLASDYAVAQIKTVYEHLTKPPTVKTCCAKTIPYGTYDAPLRDAITLLLEADLPALPLQDASGTYRDTLFLTQIVRATLQEDFLAQPVHTCLISPQSQALFMPEDASVYEISGLFSLDIQNEKHPEVVWITSSGTSEDPIIGVLTALDLPRLDQEIVL